MFLKQKLCIIVWKLCQVSFETGASGKCGSCPVHIHGRDPKTAKPTTDPAVYREIVAGIKAWSNVIVCVTTGVSLSLSDKNLL